MSAKTVDLSLAIVELLKLHEGFVPTFIPERRTVPYDKVEQLNDLRVVVFDGPKAAERTGRAGAGREFTRTYKPTVAVLKKLAASNESVRQSQSDELQSLVGQIEEVLLADFDALGLTFIGFDEEQERDPFNIEMLKGLSCFAVATTLEYSE